MTSLHQRYVSFYPTFVAAAPAPKSHPASPFLIVSAHELILSSREKDERPRHAYRSRPRRRNEASERLRRATSPRRGRRWTRPRCVTPPPRARSFVSPMLYRERSTYDVHFALDRGRGEALLVPARPDGTLQAFRGHQGVSILFFRARLLAHCCYFATVACLRPGIRGSHGRTAKTQRSRTQESHVRASSPHSLWYTLSPFSSLPSSSPSFVPSFHVFSTVFPASETRYRSRADFMAAYALSYRLVTTARATASQRRRKTRSS